jgi:hypothetical protein
MELHVAQDRLQWQPLVNTVINLQVPYKAGELAELLADSKKSPAPRSSRIPSLNVLSLSCERKYDTSVPDTTKQ